MSHANEVLAQVAERWLQGESLFTPDKLDLQKFIGSLRFVLTSERPVEGQHAKIHRQGLGRPNHTVHYQSYFVRAAEMARSLEDQSLSLESFGWFCQAASNHRRACASVGLSGHPSLQNAQHQRRKYRDPVNSSIVYHADPFTLYQAAPPDVDMRPPPPPAGGGNGAADDAQQPLEDGSGGANGKAGLCQFRPFLFLARAMQE